MHKSRLGTIVIGCHGSDLERDAAFRSNALGCEIGRRYEPGDENCPLLESDSTQPKMLLQRVGHPSSVHLDIETDDFEAEVRRLENLGAVRIARTRDWRAMEAPSKHRFCVQPQRIDFDDSANVWNDVG